MEGVQLEVHHLGMEFTVELTRIIAKVGWQN